MHCIKPGESEYDLTAVVNLPYANFFYQRPKDPRNEYFASLIASEMETVRPDMRSVLYMKIINLIYEYHARRGDSTEEVQEEIRPCSSDPDDISLNILKSSSGCIL